MISVPTKSTYEELQVAYDFFNEQLFDSKLPNCLITLQRYKKTYGYFSPDRFTSRSGAKTDEIAMNPSYFAICKPEEIMQTLVHEMTHLWQHHFGKPGRRNYHNKEWAQKMESLGLMPSATGKEGGKKTGEHMCDYVIDGGKFKRCCDKLLTNDFCISWADSFPAREKLVQANENGTVEELIEDLADWGLEIKNDNGELSFELVEQKQTRVKFSCPRCQSNAWGKPSLNLICGNCNVNFKAK